MKLEFIPEGSEDCPLILIYGTEKPQFVYLLEAFKDLASGKRDSVSLHLLPGFEAVGEIQFECIWGKDQGVSQVSLGKFEWRLGTDAWDQIAGLVEPFSEIGDLSSTQFQFLDTSSSVSVLISTKRSW